MSLMKPLANRLGGQTTPAKSLVMPRTRTTKTAAWHGWERCRDIGKFFLVAQLFTSELQRTKVLLAQITCR